MKKKMKKHPKKPAKKAAPAARKPAPTAKKASTPLTPLNDRVLVRPLSAEEMGTTTASGIIIPDTAKEKPEQGTVIAVGPGRYEDGKRIPVGVPVGARVMFSKYGYDEIKIGGVLYYVIAEANVLAIVSKDKIQK